MSTDPSVSILIPCRNAEPYLKETLACALAQSLRPLEVLLVDDGSTDRSPEIAAAFAPDVTMLTNDGRGASAARNLASRAASGRYFQYLDADDLLEPHALASRVDALERTGAGAAVSDWLQLKERDGRWQEAGIKSGRPPEGDEPLDVKVFRGFWAPPAAILYRRSVVERIGGWRETLPVIQDARFLLDAALAAGRFAHVPGVGARYRQHRNGSLSSTDSVRFWRDVLVNAGEVERKWLLSRSLDAPRRAALADSYSLCARLGFVKDQRLYEDSVRELKRFPEFARPRFLRVAHVLTSVAGYAPARYLMTPFCRS